MPPPFFTIGHSSRAMKEFVDLLRVGGVEAVVDIRTVPRSRTNPQYDEDALGDALVPCRIGHGKQLLPQGYRRSFGVLNLGYRRKVDDKLSLLLTGRNVLDSVRQVTVFETPTLADRLTQRGTGRIVMLGLVYNLGGQGGRKKPDPAFDFPQGGVDTPQ